MFFIFIIGGGKRYTSNLLVRQAGARIILWFGIMFEIAITRDYLISHNISDRRNSNHRS